MTVRSQSRRRAAAASTSHGHAVPAPRERDGGAPARPDLSSITLRAFEIFTSVVQSGSMSAAAERLGVTQPAISQALRALEKAIGQELFDRTMRPPVLTLAGHAVLHHAAEMIEHMHALEGMMRSPGDSRLPMLRIGMADSFAATGGPFLIERIQHLAASWSIDSGPVSTRINGLIERRVDAIVSFDDTPLPPDFLVLPLFSEPYFLALPASFTGGARSLRELAGRLDMLRYGEHLHVSRQIEGYLQREAVVAPHRYRFDTIDAVIAMVAAGLGWALVTPLCLFKSSNVAPRIRCLPLPGRPLRRNLVLAMRREEGKAIAPLIQRAATDVFRDALLPAIDRLIPRISAEIAVGARAAGRGGKSRRAAAA